MLINVFPNHIPSKTLIICSFFLFLWLNFRLINVFLSTKKIKRQINVFLLPRFPLPLLFALFLFFWLNFFAFIYCPPSQTIQNAIFRYFFLFILLNLRLINVFQHFVLVIAQALIFDFGLKVEILFC